MHRVITILAASFASSANDRGTCLKPRPTDCAGLERTYAALAGVVLLAFALVQPAAANDRALCYDPQLRDMVSLNGVPSFKRARDACRRLINSGKFPKAEVSRLWVELARNYYELEPNHSIPDYTKALEADPTNADALEGRAKSYSREDKHDLAIADATAAIRRRPARPSAYKVRAEALAKADKPEAAEADTWEALRLASGNAEDLYLEDTFSAVASAYNKINRYDRAAAAYAGAIRVKPSADYYNWRAQALERSGNLDLAIAAWSEAAEAFPNQRGTYLFSRGKLLERQGELSKALADFRTAASLAPGDNRYPAAAVARVEAKLAELARKPGVATASLPGDLSKDTEVAAVAQPESSANQSADAVEPQRESRTALVIGNSAYANTARLPNPKNDADLIGATLRRTGFSRVDVHHDLGRDKLLDTLKAFAAEADKADWAIVYFAGHGMEIGGVNYLVPVDAKLASDRDIPYEAISVDQVLHAVGGTRKLKLVVLDACRDNPFLKTMTRSVTTRAVGRGLAQMEPDSATLVAFAARHGQVAQDGEGANSPFAAALAKAIETPGLEISLLLRRVRDDVLAVTGRRQEPFTYGSLPSEAFYFRTP